MRKSVAIGATLVAAVILSASPISVKRSMAQGLSISPLPGVHIGIGHHHDMGYPVEHHHHHYGGGGDSYYDVGGGHRHYGGGEHHHYYAYAGGKRKNKPYRGD